MSDLLVDKLRFFWCIKVQQLVSAQRLPLSESKFQTEVVNEWKYFLPSLTLKTFLLLTPLAQKQTTRTHT